MSVLIVEKTEHIACVILNRPTARNALDPELVCRLVDCWEDIKADANIRAVVLTGAENSTFCAGFDLRRTIPLMTGDREPDDKWDSAFMADGLLMGKALLRDFDLEKPLIVAANGHAIAGGMELLSQADIRVVAEGAVLGLSEVKLGLIPAMGGTARLVRKMPSALAAELLLTGNNIPAARAAAVGYINHLVPVDEVRPTAMALANAIAENAPLAVAAARNVMRQAQDLNEADALALEAEHAARLSQTEDAKEGPRAFIEKRKPVFQGR